MTEPFLIKSCTLAAIATGEHAISVVGLRDKVATVPVECLYYHFWGGRLFTQFSHQEYHNDFAIWAHESLKDDILAERLSILDPMDYNSLEDLRSDILEVLDKRLDEFSLLTPLSKKENLFHFIRSLPIIFDTSYVINVPSDLPLLLPSLSPGSIFYHFIAARSRTEQKRDDFSLWIQKQGEEYAPLVEGLGSIDPYFLSLSDLRREMIKVVNQFFETRKEV